MRRVAKVTDYHNLALYPAKNPPNLALGSGYSLFPALLIGIPLLATKRLDSYPNEVSIV